MTYLAWLIFLVAALMEVGGNAAIRMGLRAQSLRGIAAGFIILGAYGMVVNTIKWDFSRLLGVYVSVFAVVSILSGQFIFKETIPLSTWLGLSFIVLGGLVIQFGPR